MKTILEKGSIMIASPLYHQKGSDKKGPHSLLRYVTQRSLAVVMFIAFAFLASIGNKSSITPNLGGKQASDEGRYLSLNPRYLFDNIARSVKDAFNDPVLVQYADDQGAMDSPTLTMPTHSGNRGAQNFGNKCAVDR
jgi:hypothetical protein